MELKQPSVTPGEPTVLQKSSALGCRNYLPKEYMDLCCHRIVEQQADEVPQSIALVSGSERITFGDLNARANRLAYHLRSKGVKLEEFVGIAAKPSPEAIVGVLAVLKAGGAFLPLDTAQPSERIRYMIEESGTKVLLADGEALEKLPFVHAEILRLDQFVSEPSAFPSTNLTVPTTLENAACLLYTSGSTGRPKGVIRIHRGIVDRLAWYPCSSDDVFSHNMSLSVGFSQERLFLPLMHGLPIVIVAEDGQKNVRQLVDTLASTGVTHVTLVPETLRQLLSLDGETLSSLGTLRSIAVGSAPVPPDLVERFSLALPHVELINAYGSTESGVVIRGTLAKNGAVANVTLGRPVATAKAYVLTGTMEPVPIGVAGELYVSSPALARGYLHQPVLTAERFLLNPFQPGDPGRLYRTGDICRYLADGQIEFLGRADRQVKVRGHRVELGEIEATLLRHEAVQEAVVTARSLGSEGTSLAAYVVWGCGAACTVGKLQDYLARQLPAAMRPSAIFVLDAIPRTPNCKVDVSALPDPRSVRPNLDVPFRPPTNQTEVTIAQIWSDILHSPLVGVEDDFFQLGGDSLSLEQMVLQIAETFGREIRVGEFLQHPTISGITRILNDSLVEDGESISRIDRSGSLPLSFDQEAILFGHFRSEMQGHPVREAVMGFGLHFDGRLDTAALKRAVDLILDRHEILRTGFVPVATVGSKFEVRGRNAILQQFHNSPLQPSIHFEGVATTKAQMRWLSVDLQSLNEQEVRDEIQKLATPILLPPFNYSAPPFIRMALIESSATEHYLIAGVSHLVFDGLSIGIFQRDLSRIYQAILEDRTPEGQLHLQFADYAKWQRDRLRHEAVRAARTFWVGRYSDYRPLEARDLPFSTALEHDSSALGRIMYWAVDDSLCIRIRSLAARIGVTLYIVFLAAVGIFLHLSTAQQKFAVGTHFANRDNRSLRNLIGNFATFNHIGLDFSREPTIEALLIQLRSEIALCKTHEAVSKSMVLAFHQQHERNSGRNRPQPTDPKELPVIFEFVTRERTCPNPDLTVTRFGLLEKLSIVGPFPLRFRCVETSGRAIQVAAAYHFDVFKNGEIRDMLQSIERILQELVANSKSPISSLSFCLPPSLK